MSAVPGSAVPGSAAPGSDPASGPPAPGNSLTGAEAVVRMLDGYGVTHLFGLCGDTSLPFYDALYRLRPGIRHILTRDERSAGYMADCYARVTGKVGVCEGPSGGGATYILPGLVEANESSVPVLAITSDIAVSARGRFALTDLDQAALFRPVTKWNAMLNDAAAIPDTLRAAFRAMTTGRPGSAHIGLPIDVQKQPVDPDLLWCDPAHARFPAGRAAPEPTAVAAAAAALLSARDPIMICGGGPVLSGAEAAVQALAERLDMPVATTISGQGSLADDHPLAVGVVGSNGGTPPTRAMVAAADLVLFVGCRAGSVTTERWRVPAPGSRIVHIDCDPAVIGATYRTEVAVIADARLALEALLAEIGPGAAPARTRGRAAVAAAKADKQAAFAALAVSDDSPIKPERTIAALQAVLPDDAVIVADPGTPCPYVSAYVDQRRPGRRFISNRAHGALGYALSGAVGAAIGRPGARVVAAMGDGSFGFTCGELETVVRLGLPITMLVFSNSVYGWIKAGQKTGFGGRYHAVDFSRTDHAAVAAAFGVRAWTVADPAALQPTLAAALAHDGPTLVDVISQPLQDAAAPVSEWIA